MAFAALAFVACGGNEPNKPNHGGDDPDEPSFVSPISTKDNTFSDWDAVASKTVSAKTVAGCQWQGLKEVKVYADQLYLNIYCEFDESIIADRNWVPFHVYLNADGDDKTGAYTAEFADCNAEVLLEDGIINGEDANYQYNPAVFQWFGGENGGITDQTDPAGWNWTDANVEGTAENGWGAIVATGSLPIGTSQVIGNKFEIQLMRELIPFPFADKFGVGVDIQQDWNSVGVLPNAAPDEAGNAIMANKLVVTVDK